MVKYINYCCNCTTIIIRNNYFCLWYRLLRYLWRWGYSSYVYLIGSLSPKTILPIINPKIYAPIIAPRQGFQWCPPTDNIKYTSNITMKTNNNNNPKLNGDNINPIVNAKISWNSIGAPLTKPRSFEFIWTHSFIMVFKWKNFYLIYF